jgi:hypothetical protein
MKDPDFVSILQEQAQMQSKLHKQRLLPKNVDWLTSMIGNYPWQFILGLSVAGALIWQLFLS